MRKDRPQAFVLLNPAARGGRGEKLWDLVASDVSEKLRPKVCDSDLAGEWKENVGRAITDGIRIFIAAGGDGTVSALVNALASSDVHAATEDFLLGAVGLGSSNDFHKPFSQIKTKAPLCIDPDNPGWRDICIARCLDSDWTPTKRHFIVSASMGLTAEANHFFNNGDLAVKNLKKMSTEAAIGYAALRTIARYRNIPVRIHLAGDEFQASLTNLSVLKTPYVSGSFHLDVPVFPDDGNMGIALAHGLGRTSTVSVLLGMLKGRFKGQPGCVFESSKSMTVEAEGPAALELDGEVCQIRRVDFETGDKRIRICR